MLKGVYNKGADENIGRDWNLGFSLNVRERLDECKR